MSGGGSIDVGKGIRRVSSEEVGRGFGSEDEEMGY